ncbi:MAG: hypothetical protein WC248_04985 [Candidatus Methanomethylophilaceae archaeon]|jgi:hypothetical protein
MKKYKYLLLIVFICLAATVIWAADGTYTTGFYIQQGGDRAVVASGGSLDVESGGEIDIESGGSLKIAGTAITSTAAELNKLASLSGDVLSTTNTKTVTNKTLSGATFTGTIASTATHSGGTYTGSTLTSPAIAFGVASKVFSAGEDWTLSASEATAVLLTLSSGSGTPSIVDAITGEGALKIVRNASNVSVTLKVSGQTGVAVASGKTAILINNGTDYVRVTADATH